MKAFYVNLHLKISFNTYYTTVSVASYHQYSRLLIDQCLNSAESSTTRMSDNKLLYNIYTMFNQTKYFIFIRRFIANKKM